MCFNDYITGMCIMDSIENYLDLGLRLGYVCGAVIKKNYHFWIVSYLPHAWTVLSKKRREKEQR